MNKYKKFFSTVLIALMIFGIASCKAANQNNGNSADSINNENTSLRLDMETSDDIVLENPQANIISDLKITGQTIDLKVSGNYLYVTNDLGYLYIVDIKDKTNPEVIGKCAGIDAANIVFIEDDYAYISYSKYDFKSEELKVDYGFKIVDIKNKEQPKVIGNWGGQSTKADKSVHGIFIKGDYALLTLVSINENESTGTFQIVDIKNKTKPVSLGSTDFKGSANAVWAAGDYACVSLIAYDIESGKTGLDLKDIQSKSYLKIIDIKDKKNPIVSGSCEVLTESWGLYSDENFAYLSNNNYDSETKKYYDSSVQIVDIKDKKAPKTTGSCKIKGGAWEIDFKDDYLFVSNLDGGFDIIDVKDKKNPIIINSIKTKGATYDIEVSGIYGYLADGFEGLTIFKLETAANLLNQSGGSIKNNKPGADIEISGDEADSSDFSGIYTFAVNNPVYFSGLGSYDVDGDDISYTWDIEGSNFYEYATPSNDKLSIVFNKAGEYVISLKVSDGNMEDVKKETVKIVTENIPVNIIKNHEFIVEIITRITNNSGFSLKDLECFTKAPQNYLPFQEILGTQANSKNQEILFDNDFNKIMHYKFDTLEPGKTFTASLKCKVKMPQLSLVKLNSNKYFYEKDDPDLSLYTTEDLFIDSDSNEIINAARSVTGKETDPVAIAKKLYNFVTKKMEYDYERAKDKDYDFYNASEILKLGKGVCADYAILYTALLRAVKIPARIAAGVPVEAVINAPDNTLSFGHAWVEIKLPGYGWVPFDVTSEDYFMPDTLYLNLAMERGSSFLHKSVTMDWSSYYFDGFNYKWDGTGKADVDQDISYKVYDLKESELGIYN
ncbi:MAG: transglutaminase domain-containing protein [Candidatus Humimicrobiaceae bacterium]